MIADNLVKSHVPLKAGLHRYTRQTPSKFLYIKVTTELKKITEL